MKNKTLLIIIMTIVSACKYPKKLYTDEMQNISSQFAEASGILSQTEISHLPEPIKKYFHHCGFVGLKNHNYAEIVWEHSSIKMKPDKKWMKLKTKQFNAVAEPARLAYMKANLMGIIPFEGRDKYHNGNGHMYGTLANLFKVFDVDNKETSEGAAIVLLAEALLVPCIALQKYIVWENVDSLTANARFIHQGINVGGTFHFNHKGEYTKFTTNERPYSKPDGTYELIPYTILIQSYQKQNNMLIARDVSAIWHLPEGDFEYWKGSVKEIRLY